MFRLLNLEKSVRVGLSLTFSCTPYHVALHLLSLHSLFYLVLVQLCDGKVVVTLLHFQIKVHLSQEDQYRNKYLGEKENYTIKP